MIHSKIILSFEILLLTLEIKISYSIFLSYLKLEYGGRSTKILGAKIFKDLPIEVCKHCKEKNFNSIMQYFMPFYLSIYATQCFTTIFDFYWSQNSGCVVSQKCASNTTMYIHDFFYLSEARYLFFFLPSLRHIKLQETH